MEKNTVIVNHDIELFLQKLIIEREIFQEDLDFEMWKGTHESVQAVHDYIDITINHWKKTENFPMELVGGIWISDTILIAQWRKKKIDPHGHSIMDINERLNDILVRIEEIERMLTSQSKIKKKSK